MDKKDRFPKELALQPTSRVSQLRWSQYRQALPRAAGKSGTLVASLSIACSWHFLPSPGKARTDRRIDHGHENQRYRTDAKTQSRRKTILATLRHCYLPLFLCKRTETSFSTVITKSEKGTIFSGSLFV
jgi:hypothetical protein